MDLRTYTESLPRGGVAALAERLGIGSVYLSQLSGRQQGRVPSPELCVAIEVATGGAVTRRDLRPGDWCRIWPELRDRLSPDAGAASGTEPSSQLHPPLDQAQQPLHQAAQPLPGPVVV